MPSDEYSVTYGNETVGAPAALYLLQNGTEEAPVHPLHTGALMRLDDRLETDSYTHLY